MNVLTRDLLETLAHTQDDVCLSLYMPTFHVESELSQNTIRLKNLLNKARQQLKETGYKNGEVSALLDPFTPYLNQPTGWGSVSEGLAAFATPNSSYFFRIPLDVEELALVNNHFHLKPLFPLLATNNRYYVLALSQNRVQLFEGTHEALHAIDSQDIPKSLIDALGSEEEERSLQSHVGVSSGHRHDAVFHGHGVQNDDKKSSPQSELRRFFQRIDEGVQEVLGNDKAPLVLAGVEYYLPIYREANGYVHLVNDQIVRGNPDHLSAKQLHESSWDIVKPLFLESQEEEKDQFHQLSQRDGMASTDLQEILPAAIYSRIDTLFVPIGEHQWGRYDRDSNTVTLHDKQEAGDEDLYDLAAVHTYLNGGTVQALQIENMPTENGLAATFRFPAQVEAEVQG
ncbi:MAG TPA: hypothetical protein VKP65_13005 [Rhodothermales bacterium]|nr:hypothetical protein [Rhodothermales bacterium]